MRNFYALIVLLVATVTVSAQDTVRDRIGGGAGGTVTWSASTDYYLDGYVFVEAGDTLIIEPGTVIRGLDEPTDGSLSGQDTTRDDASALIVAQGGYIDAQGTAAAPIIFTTDADADLNSITDVTPFDIDRWGGLIVLGNSCLNTDPGRQQIEGIPSFETRAVYGEDDNEQCDDTDNSGILRYISIRHGGRLLGTDNEINGLTLGAVGSGTTIEYVEIFSNQDDGIEFFGGTVNTKYIASMFVGDDGFDYDQGFRGKGQFWFVVQRNDAGGEGGEFDGGTGPEEGMPFAIPQVSNATFIGQGPAQGSRVMRIRDNAGGLFHNSIFTDFARGVAIEIRDGAQEYSVERARQGDIQFKNNIFFGFDGNDLTAASRGEAANFADDDSVAEAAAIVEAEMVMDSVLNAGSNVYVDPAFKSVDANAREDNQSQSLDPRPTAAEATSDLDTDVFNDAFFTEVGYKGAFSQNGSQFWLAGWTAAELYGFLPANITSVNAVELMEVSVAPNPTTGEFVVTIPNVKVSTVEMVAFDVNGRQLFADVVSPVAGNIEQVIDLSAQPAGVYYVSVKAANAAAQTLKVIKEVTSLIP